MSVNRQPSSGRIVLVAIPDEWQNQVQQILEENGYSVIVAASEDRARVVLQEGHLNGAVIIADWARAHEGADIGLLQLANDRIPTVCLVRKSAWERWFEELYRPPLHEYCSIPFTADELLVRLNTVISKAETGT